MSSVERITYTIEEAAEVLGIGRSLAYDMASRGELPSLRLGRRVVVPRKALEEWLAAQIAAQRGSTQSWRVGKDA